LEQLNFKNKLGPLFQKYKFVFLIIAAGIILMLLPTWGGEQETQEVTASGSVRNYSVDSQLKTILSQVNGAGRVEVMLTTASGEETVYQTDSDISADQSRQDTVIISGTDRLESGLVTQVNPPVYLGAIVVCDGADDPAVRLSIVEAVSKATGLGADKISVLKMK